MNRTSRMKSKKKTGYSIKYIDSLWSKAVRTRDRGKCRLCMSPAVDAHHIVHRSKNWALRWDMSNGISLCREHHNEADKLYMVQTILSLIDSEYLIERQKKYKFKADYLTALQMSEKEFKAEKVEELKEIIKNSWAGK